MKKFLTKIVILSFVFFVFDKLFLFVPYLSAKQEVDKRLELILNGKMEKDIIILGSSRGARNIIAEVIENETHLSSYSLCYPGSNVKFHEFVLKNLLQHNAPPKILILVIDEGAQFVVRESLVFRNDRLYPLVGYDAILNELILQGEKTYLSKYMALFKLQPSNFDFRKKHFTSLDTITTHGSMPISFQRKNRVYEFDTSQTEYNIKNESETLKQSYLNIVNLCETNNIRLINVFPPNYKTLNTSFVERFRSISQKNIECYFYNERNPVYSDRNYFYDEAHLKNDGALIFTKELSDYIINSRKHEETQLFE